MEAFPPGNLTTLKPASLKFKINLSFSRNFLFVQCPKLFPYIYLEIFVRDLEKSISAKTVGDSIILIVKSFILSFGFFFYSQSSKKYLGSHAWGACF